MRTRTWTLFFRTRNLKTFLKHSWNLKLKITKRRQLMLICSKKRYPYRPLYINKTRLVKVCMTVCGTMVKYLRMNHWMRGCHLKLISKKQKKQRRALKLQLRKKDRGHKCQFLVVKFWKQRTSRSRIRKIQTSPSFWSESSLSTQPAAPLPALKQLKCLLGFKQPSPGEKPIISISMIWKWC